MATCPKCFKEKPILSPHCPHCTQRIRAGDEIGFAIWEWIIAIGFLMLIFGLISG
jgi:hypothetical protein